MSVRLTVLDTHSTGFPPVSQALTEPDGLLCVGGDLSPARILDAYRQGIFPWYSEGDPILWWSPDPRMVFRTDGVRLPSKFRRSLRSSPWVVRFDTAFEEVIRSCASVPRTGQSGTWIVEDMIRAYTALHRLGYGHSVEVWDGTRLVGGLYGLSLGQMFFGESMFSAASGASKVAIAALAGALRQHGWPLIDCQVENPHLRSLGAERMARRDYVAMLATLCARPGRLGRWGDWIPDIQAADLAAAPGAGIVR